MVNYRWSTKVLMICFSKNKPTRSVSFLLCFNFHWCYNRILKKMSHFPPMLYMIKCLCIKTVREKLTARSDIFLPVNLCVSSALTTLITSLEWTRSMNSGSICINNKNHKEMKKVRSMVFSANATFIRIELDLCVYTRQF